MREAGTAVPPFAQLAAVSDSYQVMLGVAIGSTGLMPPAPVGIVPVVPAVPVPGPTPVPALPVPIPGFPAPIWPSLTHATDAPAIIASVRATAPKRPRGKRSGVDFI